MENKDVEEKILFFRGMIANLKQWQQEAADEQSKQVWQQRIEQHEKWIEKLERGA